MRLETADRLKGLCIVLMIVGHCAISSSLHDAIYLFHIPLFFFVSGYFLKSGAFSQKVVLDCRRLLVPYALGIALVSLKYGVDAVRLNDASSLVRYWVSAVVVGPNIDFAMWEDVIVGPIWFLLALFWGRVFLQALSRFRFGGVYAIVLGVVVCSLPTGVVLPLGLQQGFSALAFMGLGYELAHNSGILVCRWSWPVSVVLVVPALWIPSLDMYLGLYPIPVVNVVVSMGAIVFLWKAWYLLENKKWMWLGMVSYLGRISLLVLLVHYYEAMTFDWYAKLEALPAALIPVLRVAVDLVAASLLAKVPLVRKVLCLK